MIWTEQNSSVIILINQSSADSLFSMMNMRNQLSTHKYIIIGTINSRLHVIRMLLEMHLRIRVYSVPEKSVE